MAMRRSSPAALAHRPPQPVIWPQITRRRLYRTPRGGIPRRVLLRPAGASRWMPACERHAGAVGSSGRLRTSPARPGQTAPSRRTHPAGLQRFRQLVRDRWPGRWQLTPSESACRGVFERCVGIVSALATGDTDCTAIAEPNCRTSPAETLPAVACGDSLNSVWFFPQWLPESRSALPHMTNKSKNTDCHHLVQLYCASTFRQQISQEHGQKHIEESRVPSTTERLRTLCQLTHISRAGMMHVN